MRAPREIFINPAQFKNINKITADRRQIGSDAVKYIHEATFEKALEVIRFYGDFKQMNHGFTADSVDEETCFVNEDDFEEINEIEKWSEDSYLVYGKKAREFLKSIEESK